MVVRINPRHRDTRSRAVLTALKFLSRNSRCGKTYRDEPLMSSPRENDDESSLQPNASVSRQMPSTLEMHRSMLFSP